MNIIERHQLVETLQNLGTYQSFNTIVLDPPWQKNQTGNYGAEKHYGLMTNEEIAGLPIDLLAAKDAHLWLWTTNSTIPEALALIEKWGFTYRSIFTWIKPRLGLGTYLRNASEQILFATRGKAPVKFKGQQNWLFAPLQDHSHKPEEQYAIIERVSPGPYLELFARRRPTTACADDWSVWGNEISSDLYIPGYFVPKYSEKAVLPSGEEAK